MAPFYLGYAALGGKTFPLLLKHYERMAQSGAAMIVVENASIAPEEVPRQGPFVAIMAGICGGLGGVHHQVNNVT